MLSNRQIKKRYSINYKLFKLEKKTEAENTFKQLKDLPFKKRKDYQRYGSKANPHRDQIAYTLDKNITMKYGKRTVKPEADCPDFLRKLVEKANKELSAKLGR